MSSPMIFPCNSVTFIFIPVTFIPFHYAMSCSSFKETHSKSNEHPFGDIYPIVAKTVTTPRSRLSLTGELLVKMLIPLVR